MTNSANLADEFHTHFLVLFGRDVNAGTRSEHRTMKTQVTFRSKKFPPYEGEEAQINPGLWGKRLAEYLVEKLGPMGIEAEPIIAEDWGWYVPIKNESFRLALCCGHQDGDEDEFLCFTEPSRPIIRKLFKKIDATEQLGRLAAALEKVLSSDPEISHVEWVEPGPNS